MCVVNQKSVNKLDLTWKQSFLILVDSELFGWRSLYQFDRLFWRDYEQTISTRYLPKFQHREHFYLKWTFVLNKKDGNNDDIQLDLNQDQAGQVVQNVPAGAQTTLAFRVEQSKIPEFWGQKAKDTVTAIVFIRKIEDLARTNH